MLNRFTDTQKNLIIGFVLFLATYIGLYGGVYHQSASLFYPAAGMYTAFYFLYRKKVLFGIVTALLLGNLVFRFIYSDEAVYISIILSFFFFVSNLFEIFLFSYLMDTFKMRQVKGLDLLEMGKFLMVIIITSIFGALFGVGALSFFYQIEQYWLSLLFWFLGSSVGMLIFASLIINTHFHDMPRKIDKPYLTKIVSYMISYMIMVLVLFSDIGSGFFDFNTAQLVLVIFYIIAAFTFTFKMIGVSNIILITVINFIYLPSLSEDQYLKQIVWLLVFVLFMSAIASIIRLLLIGIQENYKQMKKAKGSLEKIILSTNELMHYENALPEQVQAFSMRYLKNMFEIACEIYPNFDKASCSIKNGPFVEFVAVKGYDIDDLNEKKFLNEHFMWSLHKPEIIRTTDYNKAFKERKKAGDFIQQYGVLKESIRFTVIIGEEEHANISFDIFKGSERQFSQADVDNFTSFQSMMNSYFRVGILKSKTEELKDDIVESLVRTLELYDVYTGGHSEEVAKLSVEIGRRLNLPEKDILTLYWSGIVHDIGKIGIPYEIINKEGKLTDQEYQVIKEHPRHGYNILSKSKSLEDIAMIVLHHHEWWNGHGYPDGLKGHHIPYMSQILHVCDAVDAMAKDRVYRPRLSIEEIIEQLEAGMGKQFSPMIAKEMIRFIKEGQLQKIIL